MTKTIDQILDEAADYIEQYGHAKHTYLDDEVVGNPACAVGAMFVSVGDTEFVHDLQVLEACSVLCEEINLGYTCADGAVTIWNDDVERTPDEVIDNLRWAAKRVRDARIK